MKGELEEEKFEADLAAGVPGCTSAAFDISAGDLDDEELEFFPPVGVEEAGGDAAEDSDDLLVALNNIRAAAAVIVDKGSGQESPLLGDSAVLAEGRWRTAGLSGKRLRFSPGQLAWCLLAGAAAWACCLKSPAGPQVLQFSRFCWRRRSHWRCFWLGGRWSLRLQRPFRS